MNITRSDNNRNGELTPFPMKLIVILDKAEKATRMEQARDFLEESKALKEILDPLQEAKWEQTTGFKNWTISNIITHLHIWNRAALMSLRDEQAFSAFFADVSQYLKSGNLRGFEDSYLPDLSGSALLETWWETANETADAFLKTDPKTRVVWAGPSMSARSSITARLMETWAHGQAIYDELGLVRENQDRIRNIVVLGINTFGWTFTVNDRPVPAAMPKLSLTAPSGEEWVFNGESPAGQIEGLAEEFCQVVTQTRNIDDTGLVLEGDIARDWMSIAQCFAGRAETPPPPNTRKTGQIVPRSREWLPHTIQ